MSNIDARFELYRDIRKWHKENGGNFNRPAGHALRLLNEVVELCIAEGASEAEMREVLVAECVKARTKGELDSSISGKYQPDHAKRAEEWADCFILMEILRHYEKFDVLECVRLKVDVLHRRSWYADPDGVLWRPR